MDRATSTARLRRPRSHPALAEPRTGMPSPADGRPPRPAPKNSAQLKTDLLAIGLFLLGALLALGLYRAGSAGGVGAFLVQFFRLWMGYVMHVAPLLFAGAAMV